MNSKVGALDRLDEALKEYRLLERRLANTLSAVGATVDVWRTLRLIQRREGASMREVLDNTGLPPASATRAVDTLVSFGYAFRKSDESDRRSVKVSITTEGKAALQEIENILGLEFAE